MLIAAAVMLYLGNTSSFFWFYWGTYIFILAFTNALQNYSVSGGIYYSTEMAYSSFVSVVLLGNVGVNV